MLKSGTLSTAHAAQVGTNAQGRANDERAVRPAPQLTTMSYSRLLTNLLTSDVWMLAPPVRCVYITMLEMGDRSGNVEGSLAGLAHRANLTAEVTQQGIRQLVEARLITRNSKGWTVLNYEAWRKAATVAEATASATARQSERRAKERAPAKMRVAKSRAEV
jgi:hypothetical protein